MNGSSTDRRKQEGKPREYDDNDIHNFAYRIRNAYSLVESSKTIRARDKELIFDFIEHLKARRVSVGRQAKYLYHLKVLCEHLGVETEKATRRDIEYLVGGWLYVEGCSPETVADYVMGPEALLQVRTTRQRGQGNPVPRRSTMAQADDQAERAQEPGVPNAQGGRSNDRGCGDVAGQGYDLRCL